MDLVVFDVTGAFGVADVLLFCTQMAVRLTRKTTRAHSFPDSQFQIPGNQSLRSGDRHYFFRKVRSATHDPVVKAQDITTLPKQGTSSMHKPQGRKERNGMGNQEGRNKGKICGDRREEYLLKCGYKYVYIYVYICGSSRAEWLAGDSGLRWKGAYVKWTKVEEYLEGGDLFQERKFNERMRCQALVEKGRGCIGKRMVESWMK